MRCPRARKAVGGGRSSPPTSGLQESLWDPSALSGPQKSFIECLSALTATEVIVSEDKEMGVMSIYLASAAQPPSRREDLIDFLSKMELSIRGIAAGGDSGHILKIILDFYQPNTQALIRSCLDLFNENKAVIGNLITRMFSTATPRLDQELGHRLLSFYQDLRSEQLESEHLRSITQFASRIDLSHLEERLRLLLWCSQFATRLYGYLFSLGLLERAHDVFIEISKSWASKTAINFYYEGLPLGRTKSPPSPPPPPPTPSPSPSRLPLGPIKPQYLKNENDALKHASKFMTLDERGFGLIRMKQTKRDCIVLAGAVLYNPPKVPPPESNAYYAFGYAVCANEVLIRGLTHAYRQVLESQDMFPKMCEALEENSISQLINCDAFPGLKTFLNTSRRSTVWRLVQFVRSPDIDPPPCLQRDYGFKYCRQRDEVARMKHIYGQILSQTTTDPWDLHDACVSGKLFEFGKQKAEICNKDKRLMKNDYPSPLLGYDDEAGLRGLQGPFYRR